jgi:hypothetical protein
MHRTSVLSVMAIRDLSSISLMNRLRIIAVAAEYHDCQRLPESHGNAPSFVSHEIGRCLESELLLPEDELLSTLPHLLEEITQ